MTESRLLLVDDNPTNLALLKELIDQHLPGCSALLAANGEDALQLARNTDFDGAFIDVQMPGMDGLELCRRLKSEPRLSDLPVVLITAHQSSPELRAMGLDAGAYDFISQPIRNVELLARLRAMLRIRATEERLRESNQGLQQEVVQKTAALRWLTGLIAEGEQDASLPQDTIALLHDRFDVDTALDFELFRSQLFGYFPERLQRTLTALALLDEIPLRLGEQLAVIDNVKGALDFLERHNFFVRYQVDVDGYRILEPLRDFLRSQAREKLGGRGICTIFRQASDWWLGQGRPGIAIHYLLQGGMLQEVEPIIKQVAALLFATGELRSLSLQRVTIDPDIAASCPWLVCCQGVALLEEQPRRGLERLGQSLELFVRGGDRLGELFVRTHQLRGATFAAGNLHSLRELLQVTEPLLEAIGSACDVHLLIQARLQLVFAYLLVEEGRDQLQSSLDPVLDMPQLQEVAEYQAWLRLIYGYQAFFSGNWRRCFRELEASGRFLQGAELCLISRLALLVLRVVVLDLLGDQIGCTHQKNLIRELAGADFMEQTTLPQLLLLLEAQQAMAGGHWRKAHELVEHGVGFSEEPGPHLESMRLQLRGLLRARDGEVAGAARDLNHARELRDLAGGAYFVMRNRLLNSLGWIALQEHAEAIDCLKEVRDASRKSDDGQLEALVCWLLAWLAGEEQREQFVTATRRLVETLPPQEPCLVPAWYLPGLLPALRAALDLSSEARRLGEVFAARQGISLREDGEVIPVMQFQSLGGLSVRWHDQQVLQARDIPTAIRQLLSLLFSAPGLQISQDEVQSLLWPDSPAERSRSKFDSLLLRTRKLLDESLAGCSSRYYLTLQRGMLSLDHCRIDAVEFDRLGRAGIRHAKRKEFWQAEGCFRRAFRLWRGEFNLGTGLDERADLYRQDLLLLFLECAERWSEMLHLTGQDDEAVQIVQKALQCDPTQDGLVRFLHRVHISKGRTVQAGQVLRDYSGALEREGYSPEEIRGVVAEIEAARH